MPDRGVRARLSRGACMTIILQAARLLGPRQIGRRASVTTDTMKILLWELSDGAVLELHREVAPGRRSRFTLVRERGDGFADCWCTTSADAPGSSALTATLLRRHPLLVAQASRRGVVCLVSELSRVEFWTVS